MSDSFTVIESTPGYMPDDDDPPTFDNYDDAVAYLNERAAEYADDADANYRVEYGIASQDNLAAVIVWDDDKMHDLGRTIQIVRDEPDDDDTPDDTPDDDDDTPGDTMIATLHEVENGEGNGVVHWFCSVSHRNGAEVPPEYGEVVPIDMHDTVAPEGTRCEVCGAELAEYEHEQGGEAERFGLEQARALLDGTAGYTSADDAPQLDADDATRAYIECALWSSTDDDDEPMDEKYDADDLTRETRESMGADVRDFLALLTREGIDVSGLDAEQFGHDFWLTRNRHGAGFWDRGLGALGETLTTWAHSYGESNLYVADDGKLYVSP